MKAVVPMLVAVMAVSLVATPATARICRDSRGRIVKCLPVVVPPPPGCRDARGHLIPCPANPDERVRPHKVARPAHR